ncbi:MAG: hypothetical protein U0441_11630 [Polyangiaceae bacterium]
MTWQDTADSIGPLAWLEELESPEAELPTWVLDRIDHALQRRAHTWSPPQRTAFRREVAWTLLAHPRTRRLIAEVEELRSRNPRFSPPPDALRQPPQIGNYPTM